MVSVVIPVLNESATVRSVVELARASPSVSEVIVVDDGSIDGTPRVAREAGARVITSTLLGKGASMEDGIRAATNDVVAFLDGDLSELAPDLVERLVEPILEDRADFVKARFSRRAGRVTILTARPLLDAFFPELARIEQPLGGLVAGRRSLLVEMSLELDYGVDVGLLLDALAAGARIEQVDVGFIEHASHPLEVLGDMAREVVRTILRRASRRGRLDLLHMTEAEEEERHARAEMALFAVEDRSVERLALFDMDGTLVDGRFAVHLAERSGVRDRLDEWLDRPGVDPSERSRRIASVFSGVPRAVFEETARLMPLLPGAVDTVVGLRRRGFRVGIVSDSFHTATEIVRRRVFAEFSVAHLMRFRAGVATGEITVSPAMILDGGCPEHPVCKRNALQRLCGHHGIGPAHVLAAGDGIPDICMLREAGLGIAVDPKAPEVAEAADHVVGFDLRRILDLVARMPG